MAFMQPYYEHGYFVRIEDKHGESYLIPYEYAEPDKSNGEKITERYKGKWFYRLSASGYMDCTEWSGPFDTEDAAREDCRDTYDVDPDTGDDLEE